MKFVQTIVLLGTCVTLTMSGLAAQGSPTREVRRGTATPRDAAAKLPAAVLSAFRQAYPTAEIKNVVQEREHGKTVWEVESLDAGLGRDLVFDATGTVLELEEEVPAMQVPAAVSAAAAAKYPKATISKAEKVTVGPSITYELTLKGAAVRVLELTADGQPIKAPAPAPKN